ncbi:hypothetical protein ACEWY4_008650 [Coilia grayii]|uniref:PH domain-containing protein n=1 Tax=Coilia grayii TaxID=363190 RepID=A0ABD1KBF9_9TELE
MSMSDDISTRPGQATCDTTHTNRGCVAKLSFSCPLKGHYCLYSKSSFTLFSFQPHLWIHIMLLAQQSKSSEPLSCQDEVVLRLQALWEGTQLKGPHSFSLAMTKSIAPHKKDLDNLQIHLEEVRFFDLFGYSEEEAGWLCFMCNNPEKATALDTYTDPAERMSIQPDVPEQSAVVKSFMCDNVLCASPCWASATQRPAGPWQSLLLSVLFRNLRGAIPEQSRAEQSLLTLPPALQQRLRQDRIGQDNGPLCGDPDCRGSLLPASPALSGAQSHFEDELCREDGQPLIEGKLKEKQVRWKFIKRWKTRYFTLAGNQLLFRKGKSKDELDDSPIELSKVQSVKVVAKKRRDRGLPRAFEIFTDSKSYVLKAQDEKHAEEWLQCINVAVAQARERENREATTYL